MTRRNPRLGARCALFVVTVSLFLSSCAASTAAPDPDPTHPSVPNTPAFTGPWAAEFADAWTDATTEFEREAIADGVVSEQEHAETVDRMTQCMADAGIEYIDKSSGSEYTFPPSMTSAEANEVTTECEKTSGDWTVNSLYSMVSHNPENIDDSILMAECLIRVGVVPPGYTAADWDAEMENPTALSAPGGPPEVWECNDDPLDLFDE